jgi:hypothetical protein
MAGRIPPRNSGQQISLGVVVEIAGVELVAARLEREAIVPFRIDEPAFVFRRGLLGRDCGARRFRSIVRHEARHISWRSITDILKKAF